MKNTVELFSASTKPIDVGDVRPLFDRQVGISSTLYRIINGKNQGNLLRVSNGPRYTESLEHHVEAISSFNGFFQPTVPHMPRLIAVGIYGTRPANIETFVDGVVSFDQMNKLLWENQSIREDYFQKMISFFASLYNKKGILLSGDIKINDSVWQNGEVGYVDFGRARNVHRLTPEEQSSAWDDFTNGSVGLRTMAKELFPGLYVPHIPTPTHSFKDVHSWAEDFLTPR